MNQITLVTYLDDYYDYYRLKTEEEEFLISGTGLGVERKDVILGDVSSEKACLTRYDAPNHAQLISVKNIAIGDEVCYNPQKEEPLYFHAAQILKSLGLFDFETVLAKKPDIACVKECAFAVLGKEINLSGEVTVGSFVTALLEAMGHPVTDEVFEEAVKHGVLQTIEKRPLYFGEETRQLQAIGLYREITSENAPLYYDELCAICYNLLLCEEEGISYLNRLVMKEAAFGEKITATYERALVFSYYEHFGISVKKKVTKDLDGRDLTVFYVPGAMLNHTYINEYTTADNENYVFCALLDRHIRKWGRAIPVLYNDKTGKTIMLHNRMNVRMFSILVTKQNIVYYIADESIYQYDIKTGVKKIVYTEPEGKHLQEVPTVTEDGRYLLFFYGHELQHIPTRGCVLDTETGECTRVLHEDWVLEHFGNQINPFAGHFIINPKDHTLIHFLHGGGHQPDDRIWLLDTKTDIKWQPYQEKRLANGKFGEGLTHWFWMPDGKSLGWVRIRRDTDPTIGQGGICYYTLEGQSGTLTEMVTKREAIHSTPDFEGKMFVYDTYNDEPEKYRYTSHISLYNRETKEEELLYRICIAKSHPAHPHPIFSADGTRVLFAVVPDENGVVCVGTKKVR